jgi:hypothetical protein
MAEEEKAPLGPEKESQPNGFAQRFKQHWDKASTGATESCKKCGTVLPQGSDKCPVCGTPISTPEAIFGPPKKLKGLDYDVILDDRIATPKPDLKDKLGDIASKTAKDHKSRTEQATDEFMIDPLARLAVLKERMQAKRKEAPTKDVLGIVFSEESRKARAKDFKKDEEVLKKKMMKGIEAAIAKGSLLEHLSQTMSSSAKAMERAKAQTRDKVARDLKALNIRGFESQARDIWRALEQGRAFEAENTLVKLKLDIRAKRAQDYLTVYRPRTWPSAWTASDP